MRERVEVIPALEGHHDSSTTQVPGKLACPAQQGRVSAANGVPQVGERVVPECVEAEGNENKVRFVAADSRLDQLRERRGDDLITTAWRQRDVERVADTVITARFAPVTRARIQ